MLRAEHYGKGHQVSDLTETTRGLLLLLLELLVTGGCKASFQLSGQPCLKNILIIKSLRVVDDGEMDGW